MTAKLEIFTSEYCPYCERLKEIFKEFRIDFKEIRIEKSKDKRAKNIRYLPTVYFNGVVLFVGCPPKNKVREILCSVGLKV